VQHWRLYEIETPDGARSQDGESRVVLIALEPEQELGDHEVHEAAFVLVVSGEARVEAGGEAFRAVAGDLFRFEPAERRAIFSEGGARLLLVLAPWPGLGHYHADERSGRATAS
jgi:quercetin dioxygenase-like cupin family protein